MALYRRHLDEIVQNIGYIRRELPAQEVDDGVLSAITQMCNDFDSALYDVRKEVRTLEASLGCIQARSLSTPTW